VPFNGGNGGGDAATFPSAAEVAGRGHGSDAGPVTAAVARSLLGWRWKKPAGLVGPKRPSGPAGLIGLKARRKILLELK
jgi:hypothetical protein